MASLSESGEIRGCRYDRSGSGSFSAVPSRFTQTRDLAPPSARPGTYARSPLRDTSKLATPELRLISAPSRTENGCRVTSTRLGSHDTASKLPLRAYTRWPDGE